MNVIPTEISDVLILEPRVFEDERGFFFESYNRREFARATDLDVEFVQDNHSRSTRNVLRGLHYQIENVQGKLLRAVVGEIFDVAVDLRRRSPTFGRWVGCRLSGENKRQLWIPGGFAHGFLVLSDHAEVFYKTTDYYAPAHERCIRWDDPDISIDWPLSGEPIVSERDQQGAAFREADIFE